MIPRTQLAVTAVTVGIAMAASLVGACAAEESSSAPEVDAGRTLTPEMDAAAIDAEPDVADAPCDDCEFFSTVCTPDVFCPNGPFDPTNSSAGMDWRTRIEIVRGRGVDDVWAAGAAGAVAHFDGTSWAVSDVGTTESLDELWLPTKGEIAFRSLRTVYTRGLGSGGPDIPSSPGDWWTRPAPSGGEGVASTAVWSEPGADALWVNSPSGIWRMTISAESNLEMTSRVSSAFCEADGHPGIACGRVKSLYGIGGASVSLWAVGSYGLAMHVGDANGDSPVVTALDARTWDSLNGVWAASPSDVWAVGARGTIRHHAGAGVRWDLVGDVPTNVDLNAVWGTSSADVWAVGNAGVILHYDGAHWSRVKISGLGLRRPDLTSVWSPTAGHVWIGGHGVLLALGGTP